MMFCNFWYNKKKLCGISDGADEFVGTTVEQVSYYIWGCRRVAVT